MPIMGQDALRANLTLPARPYLFSVLINAPIGGGDFNTLQIRARTAEIPARRNAQIKVGYKQTGGVVYPGKTEYDQTWVVNFMEGEDQLIYLAMSGWQQAIVDNVTGVSTGQYLSDVSFSLDGVDGTADQYITLKNAWVQSVGKIALDTNTGTGFIIYPVTFAFDYFVSNIDV